MVRMLLGETQKSLAAAISEYFRLDNYEVQVESNGPRILECMKDAHYDIVALEIAMPGLDGISVVKDYRASGGTTPIILMAGNHCSAELKDGLDAGADTYVVKPFSLDDLSAQTRALLRRPALVSEKMLTNGALEMNPSAGTLCKNNRLIHLHPMEFKLLHFLLKHPNQVFDSHAIFERVWQKDCGQPEDTVRTHVRTLRRKVDTTGHPSVIQTVRGFGYKTESR